MNRFLSQRSVEDMLEYGLCSLSCNKDETTYFRKLIGSFHYGGVSSGHWKSKEESPPRGEAKAFGVVAGVPFFFF